MPPPNVQQRVVSAIIDIATRTAVISDSFGKKVMPRCCHHICSLREKGCQVNPRAKTDSINPALLACTA